jgi:heterodisulfide reductase subunit C
MGAKGSIVTLNELDLDFKYEIRKEPGGEGIMHCFACGGCTARCPVREIDEKYNPRKIIRMALLGLKEEVFRSEFVWLCSSHSRCAGRCPQEVTIGAIASACRNMAMREGYSHLSVNQETKPDKAIKSSSLDPNFKYEIQKEPGGESITHCFACGTCTASCPEMEKDNRYDPRRFIRKILLGMREEAFTDGFMWHCAMHYACNERCPQGVNISDLMNAIRNIAIREGNAPPK